MRDTLENLYFGNITPNDQIVKSGTALKKAMEQSAEVRGKAKRTDPTDEGGNLCHQIW